MPVPENIRITQLDLELNGGCNYKCKMCPQATGREREFLKKLPLNIMEKILDDALNYGVQSVSLHGSGEPTLSSEMVEAVRLVKERGLKCISFSNGYKLDENTSRGLIEAGIDVLRVSAIGYDRASYHQWMSVDVYQRVRDNVKKFCKLNREMGGLSEVHLYHLITDRLNQGKEVECYKTNWIDYTGALGEIWLMHNWSGGYEAPYSRSKIHDEVSQRTCGRPFTELLQVRAGGKNGHSGAVVACCMVLGKDSSAVLGHLDTQTIEEVICGEAYENLRSAHRESRFEDISYCKDCDQLLNIPESLVWSNIPGRKYGQSKIAVDLDHRQFIGKNSM
ncbi:MAG: radical SAM/SPASM domain-containing protein [Pseudomonadota bacterium]|nr:radical SAM/SPASM domain-containing protein [Pseudomonadota bacterium]